MSILPDIHSPPFGGLIVHPPPPPPPPPPRKKTTKVKGDGKGACSAKTHILYLRGGSLTPQDVHMLDWLLPKDKYNSTCLEILGHIETSQCIHQEATVLKCSLTGLNVVSIRSHA